MNNHILNIQSAVLSSFLFEADSLDYIPSLKTEYFLTLGHQKIFSIIKALHSQGYPVTDDFVRKNLDNSFETELLDVMAVNPITKLEKYIEEIVNNYKKRLLKQEIALLAGSDEKVDIKDIVNRISELLDSVRDIDCKYNTNKPLTIFDLVQENETDLLSFKTNVPFLDRIFGGFMAGNLITVTGTQESGKTQLCKQIALASSKDYKSLFFSLEFNRQKLRKYMMKKTHFNLKNLYAITQDMTEGNIDNICRIIEHYYNKHEVKMVFIDSQMMLYDDSKKFNTSEEETTSIFRKLHKICNTLDIIIFIIAQSSKADYQNNNGVEIFGSKKASHLADIQLHLTKSSKDLNNRELFIEKNKQSGIRTKLDLKFDTEKLEFYESSQKPRSIDKVTVVQDDHETNISSKVIIDARRKYKFTD